ncbi:PREDICTED: putative F-box protein At1g47390 [Erythranthe guttata]|uniref:putative F-box protein At1g47390 n=1 Tax=Erythranthe guttata TaxID=4155 RepID=UPI00064DFA79|nr:PREDICTED: putative F-box protein At1g47390 [Erythranthe guttata]|eukprot:XP_012852515.1 PREDICTED: putative F-box protein At1g47390 [Erythranthe guttata]
MAIELEKTSSANIPPEIIEIILTKLSSVKSLLRFKAVSKSWNTIISDPLFIQNHLQSSNNSPNNNLFLSRHTYGTGRGFPLVKFDVGKIDSGEISAENIPNGYDRILCECNGVLLLTSRLHSESEYDTYALWNPSTRSQMFLINRCEFNEDHEVDCGVCYDKITGDFKYLGTKFHTILGTPGAAIFVDGATYWILAVESTNISGPQLVYFDPRTDELKILQKPEQLSDDKFHLINTSSLGGSLCLYEYNYRENSIQIWIKEKGIDVGENSTHWKEFMTVGNFRVPFLWITPICFVGNKVVIQVARKKFVYYSPNEKTREEFAEIDVNCNRLIPYRNSLYFPTGIKTTITAQQSRFILPEHLFLA